ncbi:chorismate mutase [Streptomyces sp. NBC_01754]|uniref:chorismate mutase n=1 Tax=Streptomyces sp. NBC_01754 TaxID=2975930 RepID=UPI002DDC311B|nr:chorismate mutase [Streptomyces sp. NBC_01754]WSC95593.1 chorismate mutase [Streptomyces sp. NBC_01754]
MSGEATEAIATWRAGIDALDERIIALLEERMAISRQIQRSRMRDGGSRLAAGRERRIVQRYADHLGDDGARLAVLVLTMSRGATA